MELTDKVYVRLFDNLFAWVPTNAQKLGPNEFLILPDHEFDANDYLNLCEFIPGDIVGLAEQTFADGNKGVVSKILIKPSNRPDKKFFEFLFLTVSEQIPISDKMYSTYKLEIEKVKQLNAAGKIFYDATLRTIELLEKPMSGA